MSKNEIILSAKDLSVGYDHQVLIPDISFPVRKGEILILIGPNGAGKSTILKTLTRQLERISGTVYLSGEDMKQQSANEIAHKMAIMLTGRPDAEWMTVYDMVSTGRYPYTGRLGILSSHDREIVDEVLAMTGLDEIRDCEFNRISDGQRQRTMLARAICQEPDILIMDEPTSFLDIHYKLDLFSMLKKLVHKRQISVIMSLHELELAQKFADNILCIAHRRIDRYGKPEDLLTSDYVRELYQLKNGSWIQEFGSLELERNASRPEIFVIGGGGSGISLYRELQRQGIPFAAGVLSENDLDYPVAKALASCVISVPAFEAVTDSSVLEAMNIMQGCRKVYSTLTTFGTMNANNQCLIQKADEMRILKKWQK